MGQGDHVDLSNGVFLGEVIGKKEEHHHHYPEPPQPPSEDEPAKKRPRLLPADISDFVGRERYLNHLAELVDAPDRAGPATVIISAIDGTPGVGKTTLAVHWAHSAAREFPDGQIYLNLQGYAPVPPIKPRRALGTLLQLLGLPADRIPSTVDARSRAYRKLLADRRALIVLDNAATPEQVRPLLPGASGCVVLITSRSRLGGLAVRDGADLLTLDTLSPEESLDLFEGVLGPDRVAAERAAARDVAALCGHLPLALRIAAVRLAMRANFLFEDVLEELKPEDERLDGLSQTADEHAAVRHVFSWSYDKLSEEERRAFRLLSLHRGATIPAEAAEAVLDRGRAETRRLLESLADAHLLESDRPRRFHFHDLLRLYAQERGADDDSEQARRTALERLLSWYVVSGENADRALNEERENVLPPLAPPAGVRPAAFADADAALAWLDEEYANLLDMAQTASDAGLRELCYRIPVLLRSYFQRRSRWTEWLELQRLGLAAAQAASDAVAEAWLLSGLGDVYDDLERYDDAIRCHAQALDVHRQLDDRRGEATALNNLGVSLDNAERYPEAIERYDEAAEVFRSIGHEGGVGMVLNNLGAAYLMSGDLTRAANCYRRALDSHRRIGDAFGEAMTLHNLGEVHEELGEDEKAVERYRASLAVHRQAGHLRGEARALHRLGVCLDRMGDRPGALDSWQRAVEIFEDVGDPEADDVAALIDEAVPDTPR